MVSLAEKASEPLSGPRAESTRWQRWNRRLHYFLGLYFLFFLWLFSLTGLLLNHGQWSFAEFYANRRITHVEQPVRRPPAADAETEAKDVLRQLGISGEIQWLTAATEPTRLEFRVARPGLQYEIAADFKIGIAKVQRTEVNGWGTARALHTFSGVRLGDAKNQRDWLLTTVWVYAMDALCAGLAVMVASGVVLWWVRRERRVSGLLALACGTFVCAWLVVGLRWLQ
ncbi:MAG: hypothetical protein RIQ93_1653 [Verrucomicrobiota bacterium]|jgi:hypothetical protein